MPTLRPLRRLAAPAVLVAAACLTACGGQRSDERPPAKAQLLYVWRNFEETGIPEEMTIYSDGAVRYRNLLHTQIGIKVVTGRVAPHRLTRIRRALDAVDLDRMDASGVEPRRSGYRYVIRSHGRAGTAADGHLRGRVRPLVRELRAEMDRLRERSL